MSQSIDPTASLTADDLRFPFASGSLGLAFVMTVGKRRTRAIERLREPADLGRWLVAAELVGSEPSVSTAQLDDARALRESIHGLVRASMAGEAFAEGDREVLNAWARLPDLAPQLGEDVSARRRAGADPVEESLSSVARDAVRLLADADPSRLRECEGGCGLLFLDSSRAGNRRWCTNGGCGNRVRVATHRRRR